jgi:hypothetical protein
MKLTEHFSKEEFETSSVAAQEKISNKIPGDLMPKAIFLAQEAEKVRSFLSACFGKEIPMKITSAYRSPQLNAHPRVRGQKTSQHMKMEAFDFIPIGITAKEAWAVIRTSRLQYDQLILENDRHGNVWIHYSVAPKTRNARRMAFRLEK